MYSVPLMQWKNGCSIAASYARPPGGVLCDGFTRMLPPLGNVLAMVVPIFYLRQGTPFANSPYYFDNNFNSYPEALVTLFELLVVNNW